MRRTVLLSVLAILLVIVAPISQAQNLGNPPPDFTKVFSSSTIGPGSVATATFTIDNGNPFVVTDLAFTDTLPVAITIADPANASTTCDLGFSGSLSAPDGGSTITLSGAQIGVVQVCEVTVDVTASAPGAHTNPAITLTSSAGSSVSPPVDLTVDTSLPGFSKSFAPGSVSLGGKSTLTLTIDNSANAAGVSNLDFSDFLPAGMLIADPANASTNCGTATIPPTLTAVAGASVITLDANGTLGFPAVGAGATCTVTVDVHTSGAGELDNISGELLADFVSAGKASATLEVTVTPLAIRKAFTDDPVPPGSVVFLEFILDNFDRDFPATGVAFTDDLTTLVPPLVGLTFDSLVSNSCGGTVSGVGGTAISLSAATIAPQSSCSVLVSLAVPAGATPGAYANTTDAVTGTVDGSPVVGNAASDNLYVEPTPILVKEFVGDPVRPGDSVTLRFTVTNTSTTSMATDVAFDDELTDGGPNTGFLPFPVGVTLPPVPDPPCGAGSSFDLVSVGTDRQALRLTGGSLAAAPGPGDSCTFEVTLAIPVTMALGTYTNTTGVVTATVDGATRTGLPASDDLTIVAAPTLTKTFFDPAAPGGTVTLEFTLTHPPEANGDATGISFTDDLAAMVPPLVGLTANLPPNPDPPCGAGSSLTGTASDTLLTLMGGTLMPGESCTFSVILDVPGGAAAGNYTNTTSGVSATVGGVPATSYPATDVLNVQGLTFSKEFLGDPVIAGDTLTLRFTIANVHPTDDATITFFTDNLAASLPGLAATGPPTLDTCGGSLSGTTFLTYTGGSVTSGMSCTIEVPVLVPLGSPDGVFLNITSVLSATQGGSVTVSPATDFLTVQSGLLQLTKSFTDDPVGAGDPVTLEFILTNLDPGRAASAVGFTDDLGAALSGLTFDSVLFDDCGGTVSGTGTGIVTVTGASLGMAGSCTIRVSLTVPGTASPGVYTNTTSDVAGSIGGFPVSGDAASDDLTVRDLLLFSKSFDGPTTATGTAILTFTITNPGAFAVSDLSFSDNLDDVVSGLVATSLPTDPCGVGSSISGISFLSFSGGSLPPMGGMCSFDVEVLVPVAVAAGTYPNTTSDLLMAGLPVADPATADLTIEPPPTFAKTFTPNFIGIGSVSTLTFTIDNSASALDATNLDFTDVLPASVLIGTPANASTDCTGGALTAISGSGVVTYTGGSVGAGVSCSVVVDVIGTAAGMHVNTTGDLTSSSGNSGAASDTLVVNPPPGFAKVFTPNPIVVEGISTLVFTINNSGSTVDALALDFTDNLPAGVVVAAVPNASTTCTGGTITAMAGTAVITYTGGAVPAGAVCTVQADVTSDAAGTYVNITGDLTSSLGSSGTATDTLIVNPAPGFAKVFAPNPTVIDGISTLTFTIDNSGSTADASALDFTDNLPAGVLVAAVPNASTTCSGGVLSATAGSGVISYSGGAVSAGAVCTVQADVTSGAAGTYVNITGDLTSSLGSSGTATDTLVVNPPPGFNKVFTPNPIVINGISTLVFTIDNSGSTADATALDFTDSLPAGVIVAAVPNASTTCTGGTITADAGTGIVSYTGGSVAAAAICEVQVDVTSGAPGAYVNVSGDLTSSLGSSGTATDTLVVNPPPGFAKLFAPNPIVIDGVSTLTFTIDNSASTADATALHFADTLPGDLFVAPVSNAVTTCAGGTITANAGMGFISYDAGTVAAGAICTVQVDVTSSLNGTYVNVSGDLTSSLGNSGPATDTLYVNSAPGFSKVFAPNPTVIDGISTLTFTIDNSSSTAAAGNLDFTDVLPTDLVVAAIPNPASSCTGGTVTAVAGSSVISYTGGTVMGSESCSISVDVTSSVAGTYVNVSGDLTSSLGNSGPATDTLVVNPPPGFSKIFTPNPIVINGLSTLTFTIDNSGSTAAAGNLDFTDTLPSDLVVAAIPNPASSCTGGTVTAVAGSSVISYTGGTVIGSESCSISVDVTSSVAGTYVNVSGDLTSSLGNSGPATDTLVVNPPPGFAKVFAPNPIVIDGISTLTFTIDNTASSAAAVDLDFTDTLPADLVVAASPNAASSCTGGTITAAAGSGVISYAGGTVVGWESCSLQVDVTSSVAGSYLNVSGDLTSSLGNSGPATDQLDVLAATFSMSKVFLSDPILRGGSVDLEYTINNPTSFELTEIEFTDDFDAAMTGLAAIGLPAVDVCGAGSVIDGTSVLSMTGGSLLPGASCTFIATLSLPGDAAVGSVTSTSSTVSAQAAGGAAEAPPAAAEFEVVFLEFDKTFEGNVAGSVVRLGFAISNPDPANAVDDLFFTDDLDSVIPGLVAIDLPKTDVCGVGSSLDGTSLLTLSGGNLPPGGSCQFDVLLQFPSGTPGGTYHNMTSILEATVNTTPITGDEDDFAQDDLTVVAQAIPGLTFWGILVMIGLLAAVGFRRLFNSA